MSAVYKTLDEDLKRLREDIIISQRNKCCEMTHNVHYIVKTIDGLEIQNLYIDMLYDINDKKFLVKLTINMGIMCVEDSRLGEWYDVDTIIYVEDISPDKFDAAIPELPKKIMKSFIETINKLKFSKILNKFYIPGDFRGHAPRHELITDMLSLQDEYMQGTTGTMELKYEKCGICMEYCGYKTIKCKHCVCIPCITKIHICPICREPLEENPLYEETDDEDEEEEE